jgi:hypothetical protein
MCIHILRVIIGSHDLLIPGRYMYIHNWKLIRIKEEEDDC